MYVIFSKCPSLSHCIQMLFANNLSNIIPSINKAFWLGLAEWFYRICYGLLWGAIKKLFTVLNGIKDYEMSNVHICDTLIMFSFLWGWAVVNSLVMASLLRKVLYGPPTEFLPLITYWLSSKSYGYIIISIVFMIYLWFNSPHLSHVIIDIKSLPHILHGNCVSLRDGNKNVRH